MRLQNRFNKLEEDYSIIDRPVVRIYHKDGIVRLRAGRVMTIDEYKRLFESGEICEDCKEVLVKKETITKIIIIKNGACR